MDQKPTFNPIEKIKSEVKETKKITELYDILGAEILSALTNSKEKDFASLLEVIRKDNYKKGTIEYTLTPDEGENPIDSMKLFHHEILAKKGSLFLIRELQKIVIKFLSETQIPQDEETKMKVTKLAYSEAMATLAQDLNLPTLKSHEDFITQMINSVNTQNNKELQTKIIQLIEDIFRGALVEVLNSGI